MQWSPFSPTVTSWFSSTFEAPTDAQIKGWNAISKGDNTLVFAPTGSGKTLAAFLWAIDRLSTTPAPADGKSRLRVLYVSPLKSLTYDVERNLRSPLAGIALEAQRTGADVTELRVSTRTGDTDQKARRDIAKHPPDILITTPESLYLMLTSGAQDVLKSVEAVIIDEIHAMAATKRGAHLALSLERLERLVQSSAPEGEPSRKVQRIGLSATQRPLDEIARFLGGRERDENGDWQQRPVTIVDAGVRKQLEIEVIVPVEDMGELGKPIQQTVDEREEFIMSGAAAGDPEVRSSIWPAIYPRLLELIRAHTSTLIFVNSRRLSERLANKLNELAAEENGFEGEGPVPELVRSHHGSIAREQRLEIEDQLKAGKLPALVATSSLELGIDMGAIDLVIQVEAPPSVASGLQRIGRAGHQVGAPSKGTIFPKFRGDLVMAAVTSSRMQAGLIEHTRVPKNPIDVLAQQIVAMIAIAPDSKPVTVDDVAAMAWGTYSFSELTREALDNVLDMLAGRYPSEEFAELRPRLVWDRVTNSLTPRGGARMLAVTSGGTIPDRGLFGVFTPEGGRVGELDEEMVYESRVGETFLLGATTWKIIEITRDRVVVIPAPGEIGKMPFWHGDSPGRPYELGKAVGEFLRTLDDLTDEMLVEQSGLDPLAVKNLRQYIAEEREATGGVVPTDRDIVVERFRDELGDWRVAILTPFGARVHAPWALGIEAKLRDRLGLEVQAIWSDDGIVVRLPEADDLPPVDAVLLDPDEVDDLIVSQVGQSAVFAARFRENAARALLLPRRRPGSRTPLWQMRQRAADLLGVASRYGEFPILLETYRECLRDVFDLPALTEVMTNVRSRAIRVQQVDTQSPSPFASSLVFSYVASFMYEGDAPLAERRAQALTLDRRMLSELVGGDELRDLIDVNALMQTELELQALDESRQAQNIDSAHDVLRRLGDLTEQELNARTTQPFADQLLKERRAIVVRVAGERRLIAAEDAGRYRDGLGSALPTGVAEAFLDPVADATLQLVRRYARTHGPFLAAEPALRFALPVSVVENLLRQIETDGRVVLGEFRPGGVDREWCDVEVLRILRQRSLAVLRKEIEPTDVEALVRYLPSWQGVGADSQGLDRCYEVISRLQGIPVPISVLERDVLATRVKNYTPRLLDELLAAGEVMWVGAGPLGKNDGKVRLFLRENAPAFLKRWPTTGIEPPSQPEHERLRDIFKQRGACFFADLKGRSDRETQDALWDLVWAGEVTNDSFHPLRAIEGTTKASKAGSKPRRPRVGQITSLGPPATQGRWSLVYVDENAEPTRTSTSVVNVLMERHGVLTREAVKGEGVPGGFASIYPVLKAMEESGRIRRGYFVSGRGGAQFALPGAVDRLRAFRDGMPSGLPRAIVLAATDPANPFGVSLSWPAKGPQRVPGAFVVLIDGQLGLYVEKGAKGLQAFRPFDGTWEADAVAALLSLLGGRMNRLAFQNVPDELLPLLRDSGFTPTPRGMVRYA
jgi:ATP-dependent Lhr-like helicase